MILPQAGKELRCIVRFGNRPLALGAPSWMNTKVEVRAASRALNQPLLAVADNGNGSHDVPSAPEDVTLPTAQTSSRPRIASNWPGQVVAERHHPAAFTSVSVTRSPWNSPKEVGEPLISRYSRTNHRNPHQPFVAARRTARASVTWRGRNRSRIREPRSAH